MNDANKYPTNAMLFVWAGQVLGYDECVWDERGVQMSPATHHMSNIDP
jgi:hypothetical protein